MAVLLGDVVVVIVAVGAQVPVASCRRMTSGGGGEWGRVSEGSGAGLSGVSTSHHICSPSRVSRSEQRAGDRACG